MMLVVTADQKRSRSTGDFVPEILAKLQGTPTTRPFQRTAGDEIQAVFSDAQSALDAIQVLIEDGNWYVGVGGGNVDQPLPPDARSGRGPAFFEARAAVELAKRAHPPVVVRARTGQEEASALLGLLASLWARRTARGWEAVRSLAETGGTQSDAARRLGISDQAFSQRLQAAQWQLEDQARAYVERALDRASKEEEQ